MSGAVTARRRILAISPAGYDAIFGWAYVLLMTNLNLALANAPLVLAVFVLADPLASWPLLLALGLTAPPSLAAAFAVFRDEQDDATHRPFRSFWSGYRSVLGRTGALGAGAVLLLGFLVIDVLWLGTTSLAPLAVPFFATLAAVVVAVVAGATVAAAMFPSAPMTALLAAAFHVGVRRWYLSVVTVVCVVAIGVIALLQPILGTLVAPALLLFVVWSNTHFALAKTLEEA